MSRVLILSFFFAAALASDCVGRWGTWLPCDGVCGTQSTQERYYEVQVPATAGGAACPHPNNFMEQRACTVLCSGNDCKGSWSTCTACVSDGKCGSDAGKATRTYKVTSPQGPGGAACAVADGTTETVVCSAAVVPCKPCVGSFVDGPCVSDGVCDSASGKRVRTFKITQQAEAGGAPCALADGAVVTEPCTAQVHPCVHCVGSWQAEGVCVSDGVCNSPAGKQTRVYRISQVAGVGGKACPRKDGETDVQPCSCETKPCQDCKGHWSEYSACQSSGKCGSDAGTRTRTYTVDTPAGPGGAACPHASGFVETSACAAPVSPCRGCSGSWSEWGTCNSDGVCSSDAGHQTRTFTVTDPGETGGAKCAASNGAVEKRACSCPNVQPCAAIDCEGAFGPLSQCRAKGCGSADGTQSRTFSITKMAQFGGKACAHPNGFVETVDCQCPAIQVVPCPVDCAGHFEAPSPCISAGICSSSKGYFTEKFVVDVAAAHGGKACAYKNGYIKKTSCAAEITPCPAEHCVGEWTTSECQANLCGSAAGQSISVFRVLKPARYGGKECEAAHLTKRKNVCECAKVSPCPVDCLGQWSENTACASIGKCSSPAGFTERTYVVSVPAAHGGKNCPYRHGEVERTTCNTAPITKCPAVDCVGSWKPGPCKATKCGTTEGQQTETFVVTTKEAYDGRPCSAEDKDTRVVSCKAELFHCPIDCKGAYSEFTKCEAVEKCGSTKGRQSRTFTVSVPAAFGGAACVREHASVETQDCEAPLVLCPPVDCAGEWSAPTPCVQKACDHVAGTQSQKYSIKVNAAHGGKECEARHGQVKTLDCKVDFETRTRCPIDCVGKWTNFSKCVPRDCGCPAGTQERQFHIETKAQFGGKLCEADDKSVHTRNCEADKADIKRCPNALLDAPCDDLEEITGEAKALRCKVTAILETLEKHK